MQDAIAAKPVPLLVKIAPDATDDDLDDIVAVCRDLRMDGIIVGNTTLSRPASLQSARRSEDGRPVGRAADGALDRGAAQDRATGRAAVPVDRRRRRRLGRRRLRQDPRRRDPGAALLELVYEGPPLVRRIKDELAALLARDGFTSVADAVGADLR